MRPHRRLNPDDNPARFEERLQEELYLDEMEEKMTDADEVLERESQYGYAVDVLRDKAAEQIEERRFASDTGNDPYYRMCGYRLDDLNGAIRELGGRPVIEETDDDPRQGADDGR